MNLQICSIFYVEVLVLFKKKKKIDVVLIEVEYLDYCNRLVFFLIDF